MPILLILLIKFLGKGLDKMTSFYILERSPTGLATENIRLKFKIHPYLCDIVFIEQLTVKNAKKWKQANRISQQQLKKSGLIILGKYLEII